MAAEGLHARPPPGTLTPRAHSASPLPPPSSRLPLLPSTDNTARAAIYDPNATIVLIGMRGVGKTTLGLIAATSLRRHFGDADAYFESLHGPISSFVSKHGWPPFRERETAILKKLLEERPKGWVIACGGGVVDRDENCELLSRFKEQGGVIVHVVRDQEEVVHYLIDEHRKPDWGEDFRAVWARRNPRYESLCTHTFASLTAYPPPISPQFRMKHVETALVRLLRSVFGLASSHVPLAAGPRPPPISGPSSGEYGGYGACESELGRGAKGPRTSFVALNFPDLRVVSGETIRKVAGGVDLIEMRVDTLVEIEPTPSPFSPSGSGPSSSSSPAPRRRLIPSLHFAALNFGHLRRCSPLPILWTVRTASQGGVFPEPSSNPALLEPYLALVELGFKLGAEYVDLELSTLPDEVIRRFLALRGAATQCLGADHDRKGAWKWGSQDVLDKYLRATRLGVDVVKLVSTPLTFDANLELLKFREKIDLLPSSSLSPSDAEDDSATPSPADRPVPLLAINLGKGGQISRYLNPVLTPVTHPLLPGVAAPGQLTYAQTQQALFLSGLILEKTFFVPTSSVADAFAREALTLGLPYTFLVEDRLQMRQVEANFAGAYLGPPSSALSVLSLPETDEVLPPAAASGWADLVVPACTEPASFDVPPAPRGFYKHTNVRVLALAEVITQNLSPINAVGTHTCALLVGLRRKDRAEVLEALRMVGARWVFLLACEEADEGGVGREEAMVQDGGEAAEGPPSAFRANPLLPRSRAGSSSLVVPHLASLPPSVNPSRSTSPQPPPSSPATVNSAPPPPAATPSSLPYPLHAPLTLLPVNSFSSPLLYSKRAPTIVVSSDDLCPGRFPETLFASNTGGCALDLSAAAPGLSLGLSSSAAVAAGSGTGSGAGTPTGGAVPSTGAVGGGGGGGVGSLKKGLLTLAIEEKRLRAAQALQAQGKAPRSVPMDGWQVLGVRDLQGECERQAFRALTGRRMG
ncbi:hypothetical protein JCM8097_006241 [Rhodosporidiobolus ruineniae]